jgi:methionyl-tRNA formyltransferase
MSMATGRIALLCATERGAQVLRWLIERVGGERLLVFSFREEPHEPPFLDRIRALAAGAGARFVEARQVAAERHAAAWQETAIDLLLAVSWRYLVPPAVYRRARLGAFVLHDSLLPRYRGFAPTVWAILNGETETGATLCEMAGPVDAGAIIAQERVPIGPDDTITGVLPRVTEAYLRLLERTLPALLCGDAPRTPQDEAQASYTCKRLPEDNRIDWREPTATIYNLIRATTRPYPGACTTLDGRTLRVWGARRLPDAPRYVGRVPGRVVAVRPGDGSAVLTGDGALLLTEVQFDDQPPVCAAEALRSLSQTLGR